jgi:DNA-binding protein HU-beta
MFVKAREKSSPRWPASKKHPNFLGEFNHFLLAPLGGRALIRAKSNDFSKPNNNKLTELTMAKAMSKSQIAATVAEKVGITKKQAVQALDLVADLAYKQAKNTFTLPGLGKLVLVNRPAREMTMQFGPNKGQVIKIPAKRVVKFRVAKAAKDAILGAK